AFFDTLVAQTSMQPVLPQQLLQLHHQSDAMTCHLKIEQKYRESPNQYSSQAEAPPKQMVCPIKSKPRQYAKIWEETAYVQNTMPSSKASQISSPHSVACFPPPAR